MWVAVIAAALATLMWVTPPRRCHDQVTPVTPRTGRSRRFLSCTAAGAAVWLLMGGTLGLVAGAGSAVGGWIWLQRSEPTQVRRDRELAACELPLLVDLLASTLRTGAAPEAALATVAAALPGPAATRLQPVLRRLRMGDIRGWGLLADDRVLAPLGRAVQRSLSSGASIADAVEQLADDLERDSASEVEDRARRVGVQAAIPLGLCLLPAFLLIGIVPTVAGLFGSLVGTSS